MISKSEIREAVSFLLDSARNRDTSQGVATYSVFLENLSTSENEETWVELLMTLNRSLQGIVAHGYLTDTEYERVLLLLRTVDE